MATLPGNIIPPQRSDKIVDEEGRSSLRTTTFFEDISNQTNTVIDQTITIIETGEQITQAGAQVGALTNKIQDLEDRIIAITSLGILSKVQDLQSEVANLQREIKNINISDFITYNGFWNADVIYDTGNLIFQNGWLGVANKTTQDDVTPDLIGTADYLLPSTPAWLVPSDLSVVNSGHTYLFNDNVQITQVRVWIPDNLPSIDHVLVIEDITIPLSPKIRKVVLAGLIPGTWNVVQAVITILTTDTIIRLSLETTDNGSTTHVTGFWNYEGLSNATAPPLQNWNRRIQDNIIRIDKRDLNNVDREVELLSVIIGSTIDLFQTSIPTRNRKYGVTSITDFLSHVEYGVTLLDNSLNDILPGETTTIDIAIAIPSGASYVTLTNYFPVNNPIWASVTGYLAYDGVDQLAVNNAYGIDIQGQVLAVSPDWGLVSLSGEFYKT